jgi:formylglycine-generating enzyme required for sulfatase activity/tetratricopeptide (TPR) repeat protein
MLPKFMQKGLTACIKVVKWVNPDNRREALKSLQEHFTLTTHEIAQAYQNSYEEALQAISLGLGKKALLPSRIMEEFAEEVKQLLARHSYGDTQPLIQGCQALIVCKESLFQGDAQRLSEKELAILVNDEERLSITQLVLTQLQSLDCGRPHLTEAVRAFLSTEELLGRGILFFLQERLRQEPRVATTLQFLQQRGLWEDVRQLRRTQTELQRQLNLAEQIQPRDEFTVHTSESERLIQQAVGQWKRLSSQHPEYTKLMLGGATLLSSTGNLGEAEKLLLQALEKAETEGDRALAAFNLFQVQLRGHRFESALPYLQQAIALDPSRYALHEVEKYPIEAILGVGGMGCVLLCRHRLTRQRVVAKCLWEVRAGPLEKVFKEAFAMNEIAGEYVPQPIDFGFADSVKKVRAYFVTEYVEEAIDGEKWLANYGPLAVVEGLSVGLQMARALQLAHSKRILHLDLKPANVLLKRVGEGEGKKIAVKLIDFGLTQAAPAWLQQAATRHTRTALTQFGRQVMGTFDYAPPEQLGVSGEAVSEKSDVFSWGATVYRLLTNELPRPFDQEELPEVPELRRLLTNCLKRQPEKRPDVGKLISELAGLLPTDLAADNVIHQEQETEPVSAASGTWWRRWWQGTKPQSEDRSRERQRVEENRQHEVEVEQARQRAEAEKQRLELEVQQARQRAEAEKKQLELDKSRERQRVEENRQHEVEVEQARQQAEAEKQRLASEVEQARQRAEAEKKQIELDMQRARQQAAEAEKQRRELELEQEQQRRVEEKRNRKQQRRAEAEQQRRVEEDRQRAAAEKQQRELEAKPGQLFQFETVLLNAQGKISERRSGQARQQIQDLGKGVTLEMVYIPGGTFLMGSPASELERQDTEGPQHQVKIASFLMGKYLVTQAQWEAVMGKNPSFFKGPQRPVEQVSWKDAVAFCQKLSKQTGRTYQLPSEAQWEYACRAGTTTPFYFGETITPDLVNYDGNNPYGKAPQGQYRQETTPVGSFPPNAFGLYDMHGNVWEWCEDVWHGNYDGAPTDGSAWVAGGGEYRLLRGGSWGNDAVWCRAAYRGLYTPDSRSYYVGLRVVLCAVWTS